MTYTQLTAEVAALGFESEIENRPALLFCANRALRSIAALSPSFRRITLFQRVILPTTHIEEITYLPQEEIHVPLHGIAFSFKFSGAGTVTLKERHRMTPFSFNTSYTEMRRFLPDLEGELILTGDTSFKLMDLCCYDHTCGPMEKDVPVLHPFRAYELSELTDDFFGFSTLPTDENEKVIAGSHFRDDTLFIPSDYEGEIHLTYRRVPRAILADAPNANIDVAPSLAHLLPLLTASYLWLDDDAGKAQFYMQMYMEGIRDVRITRPVSADAELKDTHHWA